MHRSDACNVKQLDGNSFVCKEIVITLWGMLFNKPIFL